MGLRVSHGLITQEKMLVIHIHGSRGSLRFVIPDRCPTKTRASVSPPPRAADEMLRRFFDRRLRSPGIGRRAPALRSLRRSRAVVADSRFARDRRKALRAPPRAPPSRASPSYPDAQDEAQGQVARAAGAQHARAQGQVPDPSPRFEQARRPVQAARPHQGGRRREPLRQAARLRGQGGSRRDFRGARQVAGSESGRPVARHEEDLEGPVLRHVARGRLGRPGGAGGADRGVDARAAAQGGADVPRRVLHHGATRVGGHRPAPHGQVPSVSATGHEPRAEVLREPRLARGRGAGHRRGVREGRARRRHQRHGGRRPSSAHLGAIRRRAAQGCGRKGQSRGRVRPRRPERGQRRRAEDGVSRVFHEERTRRQDQQAKSV